MRKTFFAAAVTTLSIALGFVLFWTAVRSDREPVTETYSLGEEAAARAFVWLSRIEDMPFSYEELRERIGELRLQAVLTPAGEAGVYTRALTQESFAECENQAQSGLLAVYREVLRYRFAQAGYEDKITDEMLDTVMRDVYQVSVAEYLDACDVALLPSWEELLARYPEEVAQGGMLPRTYAADRQYRLNLDIYVDGQRLGQIAAFDDEYENNAYISLRGLAWALQETEKAFTPAVERRKLSIVWGCDEALPPSLWTEELLSEVGMASSAKNELLLDGEARKYYSFSVAMGESYDAFLTPVSLAMLLDLDMRVTAQGIEIRSRGHYRVSADEMEEAGYLQGVNTLVIGDASTGDLYYAFNPEEPVAIASTTKLMTCFVFLDGVAQGECSLEDRATVSERAERLSAGSDGTVPMEAGTKVPVRELLYGMLLPSSNECALVLAEHLAGSEDAFVERMNAKAEELGMENARFYNCHGLPSYEDQLVPAKRQNHMTGVEMFRMACALLEQHPEILEITSTREYHMEVLKKDVKNTNPLLYNLEGATGLKTGTTNKAGACLVTCVAAEKDGEPHNLIVVLLGAEGDESRGIVSEMAARYAMEELEVFVPPQEPEEDEPLEEQAPEEEEGIPSDPETVVKKLLERVMGGSK